MRVLTCLLLACSVVPAAEAQTAAQRTSHPWNYSGSRPHPERAAPIAGSCAASTPVERLLLAGDSWAQFMWDDDSHNDLFDKFGHADKLAVSRSLGENPGPGYSGPEYAISGSEAQEWADTVNFPWIANMVADLELSPTIDTVMLSIGGNDILAGRSEGGWYKDMDLDLPGSEEALFERIESDTDTIAQAALGLRPELDVMISSYEYPNFNVDPLWCWIYACPKRRDLSRDPDNDLITDAEINAMSVLVEGRRIDYTNTLAGLLYDNAVGEMHHYYGDGVSPPGALPRPGQTAPDYAPFPGGNPPVPSLRENFRTVAGIPADPIHLDYDGYQYKIAVQTEATLFPKFRGPVTESLVSQGGANDGWTNGLEIGTEAIVLGDDGARLIRGIISFDTSSLPPDAEILSASLYILRDSLTGTNPFTSGDLGLPTLDVRGGSFGAEQVEIGDWDAPADAVDVGCFVGSAGGEDYAVRIDLTPDGLAAIQPGGLTQFRLSFSAIDNGSDFVAFKDGDFALAQLPIVRHRKLIAASGPDGKIVTRLVEGTALAHRGLAEVTGSAKPLLDLRYASGIFQDDFESGDTSSWSTVIP